MDEPVDTKALLAERAAGHETARVASAPETPSPAPSTETPPFEVPAAPVTPDPGLPAGSPAAPAPAHAATATPPQPAVSAEAELRAQLAAANARLRQLEAGTTAPAQPARPAAVPGQPPPAAVAPGTPTPGQPVAAAPEVEPEAVPFVTPTEEQIVQACCRLVDNDPEMKQLKAEYHEAGKLIGNPARGVPGTLGVTLGPGGYRVPEIDRRIASIDEMLDPAKREEAGWASLDEMQIEDQLKTRERMIARRREKIDAYRATVEQREEQKRTYEGRYRLAREVVDEDVAVRSDAAAQRHVVTEMASELSRTWPVEFQVAVRAAKVNEKLLPKLWERVKEQGLRARPDDTEDLGTWMANAIAQELADWDEVHRLWSGEYDRAAEERTSIATGVVTPGTPAAAATPPRVMTYDETREVTRRALEQRAALRNRQRTA